MRYLWDVLYALDGSLLDAAVGALPATSPMQALRLAVSELLLPPSDRSAHA